LKQKKKQQKSKNKGGNALLMIGAVVLLGGIGWYALHSSEPPPVDMAARQAAMNMVKILPPEQFTGKTREAYQAAKDVPEVLSKMPCFCGCMEDSGHQSNLFCFSDRHGVT
jgi:hypothetical protein